MFFFDNPFLISFCLLLPIYFLTKGTTRLVVVLIASYIFYGWWDYRFLSLLYISTLTDFVIARRLDKTEDERSRRLLLTVSIVTSLGILGFFKYYNFFTDSFVRAFGIDESDRFLVEVLLPPGISFYTFQTMAYTIDVYRRTYKAEKDFVLFSTYVAFFPQLVAGPIERPGYLIPQLKVDHRFRWTNLYLGVRLFIIGCFKKLVIADNLAPISDAAFADPGNTSSLGLLIGAYCFAIQIYCDFSGYTDMARGVAKVMGIDLSLNFRLPYLASSLNDFWRRWHITLSYWLRDYVYIPLGGSRHGFAMHARNLFITFALSGLWHGANWTFVLWGALHGAWIVGELIASRTVSWTLPTAIKILITLHVVVLLWVLFRAESIMVAWAYYQNLFAPAAGFYRPADTTNAIMLAIYAAPLIAFSLWQYGAGTLVPDMRIKPRFVHGAVLGFGAFLTVLFGATNVSQFIYFQF